MRDYLSRILGVCPSMSLASIRLYLMLAAINVADVKISLEFELQGAYQGHSNSALKTWR